VLGAEHRSTLVTASNLSAFVDLQGKHAEAEQMQREEEQMHAEAELLFAALAVLALAPLSMVGERWRRPRSPCTCFSPDYAGRCWCSRSAPLAVMLADRAASAKPSLSPGDTHAPDTQVPESARRACKSLREACQQGWQTPGGRRCAIVKRRTPRGWLPQLSWRTLSLAKHYLYAHTYTHTHTNTYIVTYVYAHIHICIHTYVYVYADIHV